MVGIYKKFLFTFFALLIAGITVFVVGPLALATHDSTEATCASASGKWCKNSDGVTGWCATSASYTCPAYTQADCTAQNGKWCASSGGMSTGWCSSDLNYTCPAATSAECTAQGGEWCTSTYTTTTGGSSGTSNWCVTGGGGCPINDQATCESKGRAWCVSSGSSYGWCASVGMTCSGTYSTGSTGGTTTGSTGGTTTGGTGTTSVGTTTGSTGGTTTGGTTTGGTTTGSTGTTTDSQTTCTQASGKWCKNSDGSGWCSYSTYPCPAYDTASCTAQGGDWCAYQSGTGGWCAVSPSTCPINDKTTCEAKGRQWCVSQYSGSTGGWCTYSATEKCPAYTEADCKAQGSEWCQGTYGGNPWCAGTGGCPINDQATCNTKGKYWCTSATYSSSGWCTDYPSTYDKCTKGSTTTETTPTAPAGLTATAVGTDDDVKLNWTDNSTNETKFEVWMRKSGASWVMEGTTPAGTTTYTVMYFDSGTISYEFMVKACNSTGCSADSNWVKITVTGKGKNTETTPAAPADLTATVAGTDDVRLNWTDKSTNETRFELWKRKSSGSWELEGTNNAGNTSYTDMYLDSGTFTYEYMVKACNGGGCSSDSNWVKVTATGKGGGTTTSGNTESECRGTGGKWCKNSDGVSGWCSTDKTSSCPAYNETDCKTASGKWCKNSDGVSGWCSYGTYACPAYDKASCEAQKGEWCTSNATGGNAATAYSTGWCSTGGYGCPINDKTTCEAKGRKWCKSVYGTSWCTGSATEKCPSDNEPVPVPIPVSTGWPQSQGECVDYGGVWCSANYSGKSMGNCNMTGSKCPPVVPEGKVMCSDWFVASQQSQCAPAVTTKEGCQFKGGAWCENDTKNIYGTAASSGWCSYSKVCPKYPPSGKMTCPDNETFVTKLTDCPRKSVIEPPKVICQDGTVIFKSDRCPLVTCPDGTKVESGTTCPVVIGEQQAVCSKKGGVWCVDTVGKGRDYCSLVDKCVFDNQPPPPDDGTLSLSEMKKVVRQKSLLLVRLSSLEKGFIKLKDEDSLLKITELKDKLNNLVIDREVFAALQEIQEDAELMREIYRDALENQKGQRDEKLQKLALEKIKKQMVRFTVQIKTLSTRIARFEKQRITVPKNIKETIAHLNELFILIKETDDYDTARLAAEEVGNLSQDLNAMLPVLEQLVKMPKILKSTEQQLANTERNFNRAANVAKINKLDFADELGAIKELMGEARAALGEAKAGNYGGTDPFDFTRIMILDKLEDAEDQIQNIQGFADIRRHVGQIGARINRVAAQIKRLAAKKQDMSEAQTLLAEAQEKYQQLKAITDKKLNLNEVDSVLAALDELVNLTEKLEEMLGLSKPVGPWQELGQPLKGNEAITPLNVPELEDTLSRSNAIRNFFVRMPSTGTVLVNFRR